LKGLKDTFTEVVSDVLKVRPKEELWRAIRAIRIEGQGFRDVEKLGFGEPDGRTSEQCVESQSVTAVSERLREGDEIQDFQHQTSGPSWSRCV
jgi:hypothetical protein